MSATQSPRPTTGAYTINEAATFLKVSPRTIRNWIGRKLLRKSKALRDVRIPAVDVETFYERTS